MSWKVIASAAVVLVLSLMSLAANPAGVAARTYSEVAGNPNCPSGTHLLNLDPPANGTFTLSNGGQVVISNLTATSFDWAIHADSIRVIDAGVIVVMGGPAAALYTYSPGVDADDADTGLRPPIDPSTNQPYGITRIRFCFDPKRPTPTPTNSLPATVSPSPTLTVTATATATASPIPAELASTTSVQATPTATAVVPLPPKTGNADLLGDSISRWSPALAVLALLTAVVAGRFLLRRQP